jgi:hypothetical protein
MSENDNQTVKEKISQIPEEKIVEIGLLVLYLFSKMHKALYPDIAEENKHE